VYQYRARSFGGYVVSTLIFTVVLSVYRCLMEGGNRGQTVGKMAMRIRVRDADADRTLDYGRAFVRTFVAGLLWVAFYIPGIVDVLIPLGDAKHQTLHDKAVHSIVVRA
jgi:uncharacterized RDD family membrane protein YckC